MTAIDLALQALRGLGCDGGREARFDTAHAEGRCYLCHVPYANVLADCPCPHWLVMPCPSAARIAPVFEVFGVADVLQFLLLFARTGYSGRRAFECLAAQRDAAAIGVSIRRHTRAWSFTLSRGAGASCDTLLVRMKSRSSKDFSVRLPAGDADAEAIEGMADAIGMPPRPASHGLPEPDRPG